jgi:hypothetical protein
MRNPGAHWGDLDGLPKAAVAALDAAGFVKLTSRHAECFRLALARLALVPTLKPWVIERTPCACSRLGPYLARTSHMPRVRYSKLYGAQLNTVCCDVAP